MTHALIKKYQYLLTSLGLTLALGGCASQGTLDERNIKNSAVITPQPLQIARLQIDFAKSWLRDQRFEANPSDVEQLTQDYHRILTGAIVEFFSEQGWSVIDDSSLNKSVNTAEVSVSIKDMRIVAPDYRRVRTDLFVRDEIGSGDFNLTLSLNNEVLLQCKDARIANFGTPNQLQKTNKGINQLAFKKEMKYFLKQCLPDELATRFK